VALDTLVADVMTGFDGLRHIGPAEDPLGETAVPADPAVAGREVDTRQVTFWHLLRLPLPGDGGRDDARAGEF